MKQKSNNYKDTLSMKQRMQSAVDELSLQKEAIDKREAELIIANKELASLNTAQQTLFASIVNSSDDAVLSETLDGIITSWNHGAETIFGYKPDEILGKHVFILIPQHLQKEEVEIIKKIRNGEKVDHFETKRVKKNGAVFKTSITISPIRDWKGNITGASKILRDISERKKAETNLYESQRHLQLIYDSSSEVIFLVEVQNEKEFIFTSMNNAGLKIMGISREQIVNRNVNDIIPQPSLNLVLGKYKEAVETKETVSWEETTEYPTGVKTAIVNVSPIYDDKGKCVQLVGVLYDITERKQFENAIQENEKKLIKSNRLYAFTSAINQMILKTHDRTSLFNQACSIAVDIGKFKMAWIGMIDEAAKKVIPLVHAGLEDGYLSQMKSISIEDIPEGRGPTGNSLREGKYIICNDIENDPHMAPWKEAAAKRGYLSSIAFPIRKFGKMVGSYSLYAPVKNFFDDAEIALLMETTGDISYALESMEKADLHKKAEDKIIESEEVFRRLFDESADATLLLDDTGFTRCNKSAVSLLGYASKKEVIGRQPWDMSPEKQPDYKLSKTKIKAMILKALKDGYNFFEWTLIKADESEMPVEVMLTPIVLKGRQSFYTILRDITKRKKAEEEKKLLTTRLQLATKSADMGIWDQDVISNQFLWDEGMYRLYEVDEKQIEPVYDSWVSRLHPQDMERVKEEVQNAIEGKKGYDTDFRIVLDDSSVRYLKASGIVERDAEGNAHRMIGVNWDITELKENENQLRKSEVFNRSVVNSLSSHLAIANNKGEIISINEAWIRFALQNGAISMEQKGIGSNYFEVCEKASISGDEISAQVLQGMKDVLNEKIKDFYIEYPCHSPSEQRWFALRIRKFEGEEPLIVLLHTNITERMLAELDREKITDDLIHRNRDLEQFAYIVSHNLRAPVANIKGLSDILGDESLSRDEAESVTKKLLSSVSKLDTVILDLNDILQLKKGVSKDKERVVFDKLVNGIKESIHSLLLTENVKITTQFDEVAEMLTLKSYLYSIFYNLINNSIKYKRRDVHPVIEIKSFLRKNEIELVFKDNGSGIDLKNRGDQVFGLYKRFHPEIEGKGMGLFMVKAQVEALGGKISIESEVNQGTEFKIIFATKKKYDN